MVCAKCQKLQKTTRLATPGVKRKNDIYYGSPAAAGGASKEAGKKPSATLGNTGIAKSKLLSKGAQNPYAAYASSCRTCKTRTEQGRALCNACAYRANSCAMCGKNQSKPQKNGAPAVEGRKFSSK